MAVRKLIYFLLLSLSVHLITPAYSQGISQTLQITTRFSSFIDKPTKPIWLLIIREMETGILLPYLFDINKNDNFWIAFTAGRSYRVTASSVTFGPFAKINNFCNLENGVISGKSMIITLTGELSPDPNRLRCHVIKYQTE